MSGYCPTCGAGPNEPCTTITGVPMELEHGSRQNVGGGCPSTYRTNSGVIVSCKLTGSHVRHRGYVGGIAYYWRDMSTA